MIKCVRGLGLAILALFAMHCGPTCAQVTSEGAFAAQMRERLQAKVHDGQVTPDPDEVLTARITGGAWDGAFVNFHRIYAYCQTASRADCEDIKKDFLDRILKMPPKAAAESLRLIVRGEEYAAYIRSLPPTPDGKTNDMIFERIGEDLYAFLASDSAEATALVPETELTRMGLTRSIAWELAKKQTRAGLPPVPTADQLEKGAVAFQDQEYLGSLLLDLPAWAELAAKVGPDLFVTVVSDDFVFVATMPDGARLEEFKKTVADDCAHQQRCISPNIYRFREGRWVVER